MKPLNFVCALLVIVLGTYLGARVELLEGRLRSHRKELLEQRQEFLALMEKVYAGLVLAKEAIEFNQAGLLELDRIVQQLEIRTRPAFQRRSAWIIDLGPSVAPLGVPPRDTSRPQPADGSCELAADTARRSGYWRGRPRPGPRGKDNW